MRRRGSRSGGKARARPPALPMMVPGSNDCRPVAPSAEANVRPGERRPLVLPGAAHDRSLSCHRVSAPKPHVCVNSSFAASAPLPASAVSLLLPSRSRRLPLSAGPTSPGQAGMLDRDEHERDGPRTKRMAAGRAASPTVSRPVSTPGADRRRRRLTAFSARMFRRVEGDLSAVGHVRRPARAIPEPVCVATGRVRIPLGRGESRGTHRETRRRQ